MARGDHLRVFRDFYWHHGIDVGGGAVIHYTGTPLNISEARVEQADLSEFAKSGEVEVVRYDRAFSREKTIERAKSRLGEQDYHLVFNNCEHFAVWCRAGEHRSGQVEAAKSVGRAVAPGPTTTAEKVTEAHYRVTGGSMSNGDGGVLDSLKDAFTETAIEPYSGDGVQRELTTGKGGSLHSRDPRSGKSIPGAQVTEEFDMLGAANLGVGIVNMAIGAYNAYQINEAREDIERTAKQTQATTRAEGRRTRETVRGEARKTRREIKSALNRGFAEVKEVLEFQNGLLHTIEEVQETHGRKLDAIMYGLIEGFESIEKHIESVTRKRRNDEYLERLNALHLAKRDVAEALVYDGAPSASELRKLESRAEDFLSWIDGRLSSPDLHLLGRQPLVLAKVEARMTRIDARMFEDADGFKRRAQGRIDEMRDDVRDEVRRLHEDATPWEVATVLRDQIRNYGTLHRSLEKSRELLNGPQKMSGDGVDSGGGAQDVALEETGYSVSPWREPLPEVPSPETSRPLDDEIELRTLDDYQWFVRAYELDPSEFDVHKVKTLPAQGIAERLGAEKLYGKLESLRSLLMPEVWEQYRRGVKEEFGFEPSVHLATTKAPFSLEPGEDKGAAANDEQSGSDSEFERLWVEMTSQDSVPDFFCNEVSNRQDRRAGWKWGLRWFEMGSNNKVGPFHWLEKSTPIAVPRKYERANSIDLDAGPYIIPIKGPEGQVYKLKLSKEEQRLVRNGRDRGPKVRFGQYFDCGGWGGEFVGLRVFVHFAELEALAQSKDQSMIAQPIRAFVKK